MVLQTLNALDPSEQRRFEAYRRSTFAGDAVADFVSSCLLEASEERYEARTLARHLTKDVEEKEEVGGSSRDVSSSSYVAGGPSAFGVRSNPRIEKALHARPSIYQRSKQSNVDTDCASKKRGVDRLADMVAVDAASEITVVVSTLAKNYAQRLIKAARAVATQRGKPLHERIEPQDLLDAYSSRVRAGVDPGFFISGTKEGMFGRTEGNVNSGIAAAALGIVDKNKLKYEAALEAQEIFDKLKNQESNESKEETVIGEERSESSSNTTLYSENRGIGDVPSSSDGGN